MGKIKWIKLMVDVFDDKKFDAIKTLPDSNDIQLIWIKLLCLAGTCDSNGFLMLTREIPYTNQMLAKKFDMEIGVVQRALNIFCELRMIEVVDSIYMVSNWLKYQNNDRLEQFRENNRLRQKQYRERQKLLVAQEGKTEGQDRNVTDNVTDNVTNNVFCSISISNNISDIENMDDIDNINNIKPIDTQDNITLDNNKAIGSSNNNIIYRARPQDISAFFEAVWKMYPRKLGKGKISDSRKRKLFEEVGQEQMERCIQRYKDSVSGKDEQYVMHGSTFFNSGYVDFLDENYCEASKMPEPEPIDPEFKDYQ